MLHTVITISLFIVFSISSLAGTFRLEGNAFKPATNCPIVWNATNAFPSGLWVYKVMPEAFSSAVVSNAMRLGEFKNQDLSKTGQPLLNDKHLIYFLNKNEYGKPRYLFIAPTIGAMEYSSQKDYTAPVENVPSSEAAEKLARDILFQFGIDRSLLGERVKSGYDETTTKIDRQGNMLGEPQVIVRGISFERRINGIPLSEAWCFLIHFGSNGRIEDFKLRWRNLLPYKSNPTFTPSEIVELIKTGQSIFPPQAGGGDFDISKATKLTVEKITPRYFNGAGKEWLDFIYPYADLDMSAEIGAEKAIFYLTCPLVKE